MPTGILASLYIASCIGLTQILQHTAYNDARFFGYYKQSQPVRYVGLTDMQVKETPTIW